MLNSPPEVNYQNTMESNTFLNNPLLENDLDDDSEFENEMEIDIRDDEDTDIVPRFPPLIEMPGLFLGSCQLLMFVSLILCATVFNDDLAKFFNEDDPEFFRSQFIQYASIPVVMLYFTYVHIYAALWMNFYPLHFTGCCQIPGSNIGIIGYQGIVPFKGLQMSKMAVELIQEKLVTIDEVFIRLDPDRMVEELKEPLNAKLKVIIDQVALEELPLVWNHLPQLIKDQIMQKSIKETPVAIKQMILDMRPEIEELIDLEHLVISVLVNDMALTVDIFIVCGGPELRFIRNFGAVLGFIFGIIQMLIWIKFKEWWVLIIIGFLVGAITNWIALLIIFNPIEPVNICGYEIQGRFLKRKKQVAKAYGKMTHRDVLKVENVINELIYGSRRNRVKEIVSKNISNTVDKSLSVLKPYVSDLDITNRIKLKVTDLIFEDFYDIMMTSEKYMDEAFALEEILETRMNKLSNPDFENLLHSIFKEDEYKLILLGGVLGLIIGWLEFALFD